MKDEDRIRLYITSYSKEVTGSNNHIVISFPGGRKVRFLVDCGLFQEKEYLELNEKFEYRPEKLDFVLLTHTHTDHVGKLPYLVKKGFAGEIYTTKDTASLIAPVLFECAERLDGEYRLDLAKYNSEKSLMVKRKLNAKGRGRKDKPRREYVTNRFKHNGKDISTLKKPYLIYTAEDVMPALNKISWMPFKEKFSPVDGVEVTFYPNGHIAGASVIVVRVFEKNEEITLAFTGDLGLKNEITNVKTSVPKKVRENVDFVISESTYGASNPKRQTIKERHLHKEIIKEASRKNKRIVYLSNALERPLLVANDLRKMQLEEDTMHELRDFNIYFDSTFGISCLKNYVKLYGTGYLPKNFNIVDKFSRGDMLSRKSHSIIICTSPRFYQGSFVNYAKEILEDPNSTLIFTAYVPEEIQNIIELKQGTAIIYKGEKVVLRCARYRFSYYSSHVCAEEMDKFMKWFKNAKVMLFNHGSEDAKLNFAARYKNETNVTNTLVYGHTCVLNSEGIEKIF